MNIIPDLWLRLHFLVPDPQCQTFADDYDRIIWNDGRSQPTAAQLNAVTQAQMDSVNPVLVRVNERVSAKTKLMNATYTPLTAEEFDSLK